MTHGPCLDRTPVCSAGSFLSAPGLRRFPPTLQIDSGSASFRYTHRDGSIFCNWCVEVLPVLQFPDALRSCWSAQPGSHTQRTRLLLQSCLHEHSFVASSCEVQGASALPSSSRRFFRIVIVPKVIEESREPRAVTSAFNVYSSFFCATALTSGNP